MFVSLVENKGAAAPPHGEANELKFLGKSKTARRCGSNFARVAASLVPIVITEMGRENRALRCQKLQSRRRLEVPAAADDASDSRGGDGDLAFGRWKR